MGNKINKLKEAMNRPTNRWLSYCVKQARRRVTDQRYRLHAVLIKGGAVQAEGFNLPVTDQSAQVINPEAPSYMGTHAEMHCLSRATPEQLKGSTLYVGGVRPDGVMVPTKPCSWCEAHLIESGIARVFYHTEIGIKKSIK